jgi:hypothetical protein
MMWIFAGIAVICAMVLFVLRRDESFREESFGSATSATAPIRLYIDETSFDPVRQAIDLRFDFASDVTARGARYGGALNRDVDLSVDDGDSEQIVAIRRNDGINTRLVSLDVHGGIAAYPFDRYRGVIMISALDVSGRSAGSPIPIHATVWEGIPGWVSSVHPFATVQPNATLALTLSLRRSFPVVSFAAVVYSLMVIVAICSLCIGGMVFSGARKVESTIVGALVGMVFSTTVLRNVLPGSPPIGVTADLVVFLCAEIAVIVGLSLLVTGWVRRGPGA